MYSSPLDEIDEVVVFSRAMHAACQATPQLLPMLGLSAEQGGIAAAVPREESLALHAWLAEGVRKGMGGDVHAQQQMLAQAPWQGVLPLPGAGAGGGARRRLLSPRSGREVLVQRRQQRSSPFSRLGERNPTRARFRPRGVGSRGVGSQLGDSHLGDCSKIHRNRFPHRDSHIVLLKTMRFVISYYILFSFKHLRNLLVLLLITNFIAIDTKLLARFIVQYFKSKVYRNLYI